MQADGLPQAQGLPDDIALRVSQNADLGENKLESVEQAGAAQKDDTTGKTTVSYVVKMTTPENTTRTFKITVGFNEESLKGHFDGETEAVAKTIEKIVGNMKANDIIAASGSRISTRLDDLDKATVTQLRATGTPSQQLSDLKTSKPQLADSIGRVIKVFQATNGRVTKPSYSQTLGEKAPTLTPRGTGGSGKASGEVDLTSEDDSDWSDISGTLSLPSQTGKPTGQVEGQPRTTGSDDIDDGLDTLLADLDGSGKTQVGSAKMEGSGSGSFTLSDSTDSDADLTGAGSGQFDAAKVGEKPDKGGLDALDDDQDVSGSGEVDVPKGGGESQVKKGRSQRAQSMDDGSGTAAEKKPSHQRSRSTSEVPSLFSSPPEHLTPKPGNTGELSKLPKSPEQIRIQKNAETLQRLGPPPSLKLPPEIGGADKKGNGESGSVTDDGKKTVTTTLPQQPEIETGKEVSELGGGNPKVHSLTTSLDVLVEELPSPSKTVATSLDARRLSSSFVDPGKRMENALGIVNSSKFTGKTVEDQKAVAELFQAARDAQKMGSPDNVDGKTPLAALAHALKTNKALQSYISKELSTTPPNPVIVIQMTSLLREAQNSIGKQSPEFAKFLKEKVDNITPERTGQESTKQSPINTEALKFLPTLIASLPAAMENLSTSRLPPTQLSEVELKVPIVSARTLASEVEGHIAKASKHPENASGELMQAFQKMNQIRELRGKSGDTASFDSTVKTDTLEAKFNEAVKGFSSHSSKEAKQAKKLTDGKDWKEITPDKAANLLRKELLQARTNLDFYNQTPLMDKLKLRYPETYLQVLAEHPDVAMLAQERETLDAQYNSVTFADVPIGNYAKLYRTLQETKEKIATGEMTMDWTEAQKRDMPRSVFDAQVKAQQQREDNIPQALDEAREAKGKLEKIIQENPGTPIAEMAKAKLAKLTEFIQADDKRRCEMSDLDQMANKTPANMISALGSNIGTAFPPGKVSFTLEQIESGQLKLTMEFLKQKDPENAEKLQGLIDSYADLESALLSHTETFQGCFTTGEQDKILVREDVKGSETLKAAIKDLQGKLNGVKSQLDALGFKDPPIPNPSPTFMHAAFHFSASFDTQCNQSLRYLGELEEKLGYSN